METESDQHAYVLPVRRLICAALEVKLGHKSHPRVGLSPFNFKQWNYICFSFSFPSSVCFCLFITFVGSKAVAAEPSDVSECSVSLLLCFIQRYLSLGIFRYCYIRSIKIYGFDETTKASYPGLKEQLDKV